jgi:hypothetical protein
MKRLLIAAALAASLAALAQPYGPGPGPGPGARGPRWGAEVTPGWALMTPEERKAHQDKMRSFSQPGDCRAYLEEHHRQMQARAKERGRDLPARGPGPGCDNLKQ